MNKRLLRSMAALMSVAVVLSAGITQAFAAETIFFESNCDATTGLSAAASNATIVSVDGLKGKSTTDKVILLTELNGNRYNGYFAPGNLTTYGKYIVCEINALSTGTDIVFRGNGGRVVGQPMNIDNGEWHKVLWCIDTEKVTTIEAWNKTVPVYTYIDGEKQSDTTTDLATLVTTSGSGEKLTYSETRSMHVRLGLDNKATTKNVTGYFDDIKVYTTDELPTAAKTASASLEGDGVTVNSDKVVLPSGSTLADVSTANAANLDVRAYKNKDMLAELPDTETLKTGYTLVTEDKNTKALKYYTVDMGDGYRSIIETTDGDLTTDGGTAKFGNVRFNATSVTGKAGKAADDTSVVLTHNGTGNDAEKTNLYMNTGYKRQNSEKYLVFEANVILHDKVGDTDGYFVVKQNSHQAISAAVKGLQDSKWHKVLFYLDMTDTTALKSKMFVDGTEYGIGYPSNESVTITDYTTDMNFRFCFEGGSSTMVTYLDDISFYATNVLPTAEQSGAEALVCPADVEVNGKVVTIPKGSTPEAIKAANSDKLNIRAYTSSAMTEIVPDDVVIGRGYVIVAEDKKTKALSYYDIQRRKGNFDIEIDNMTGTSAELVIVNKESERSVVVVITAWNGEKYTGKTVTKCTLVVSPDEQTFNLDYSSLGGNTDTLEIAVWDYSGAYPKNLGEEISQYQR